MERQGDAIARTAKRPNLVEPRAFHEKRVAGLVAHGPMVRREIASAGMLAPPIPRFEDAKASAVGRRLKHENEGRCRLLIREMGRSETFDVVVHDTPALRDRRLPRKHVNAGVAEAVAWTHRGREELAQEAPHARLNSGKVFLHASVRTRGVIEVDLRLPGLQMRVKCTS